MVAMIEVEGLAKRYGEVRALDGVNVAADAGRVLGLLGPNGAGKTTLVRVLSTLLRPDAGRARIGGLDVVVDAATVRTLIGLAGQSAAVDGHLTGRENLEMVGRLYHVGRRKARRRTEELLERFSLTDAADRPARTYSGGMRHRLDLAASLAGHPQVLILDEPTTGLDPRTRASLWDDVETLAAEGTTVLLTSQYLEEVDRLADHVAVLDHGRVVAAGSPEQLKRSLGGAVVEAAVPLAHLARAEAAVVHLARGPVRREDRTGRLSIPTAGDVDALLGVAAALRDAGVEPTDIALRRPSLDEVFLALTGHPPDADASGDDPPDRVPAGRGRRPRRTLR